jgi:predicted dehydrogenase
MAMRLGKHVYCQKPLSHSIWEARLMRDTAREHGVATQMGNQAHAGEPIRRAVELIRAGMIGKVREVHAWTDRPIWPQGMTERPAEQPVPAGLAWDLWLGPAPHRPYNSAYCPFNWRGWWDFGTGALGDMGCHILDMPYWALDLNCPTAVEAEQEGNTAESGPKSSVVTYTFAPGKFSDELTLRWYDGGRMPPEGLFAEAGIKPGKRNLPFNLVFVGEKGTFYCNHMTENWVTAPRSLLNEVADTPRTLPRVANEDAEWLAACRGGPAALSNFDYSSRLTEFVLLGNLAIRLGKRIEWDGEQMKATNAPEADALIRREYRNGWELC